MRMFHVAPRRHRDRIARDGLEPGQPHADAGGYMPPAGVYLYNSRGAAEAWAREVRGPEDAQLASEEGWAPGLELWEVDAEGLELLRDPEAIRNGRDAGEHMTPAAIAPERLRLVVDRYRRERDRVPAAMPMQTHPDQSLITLSQEAPAEERRRDMTDKHTDHPEEDTDHAND